MKFIVDDIEYVVNLVSLKRDNKVETGSNNGKFISGDKFYDVRKSYYNYSMTLNPVRGYFDDYERLREVLSAPVETHEITVPYGQGTVTYIAHISAAPDNLKKYKPAIKSTDIPDNIWGGMTVNFEAAEAIDI